MCKVLAGVRSASCRTHMSRNFIVFEARDRGSIAALSLDLAPATMDSSGDDSTVSELGFRCCGNVCYLHELLTRVFEKTSCVYYRLD